MTKTTRYVAGSYLEVDDLSGGRKLVLVGKDGVTYWDAMDIERVTPVAIHPALHPVPRGNLREWVEQTGLQRALADLIAHCRAQLDPRIETDPLFVGRALWFLAQAAGQAGPGFVADTAVLEWAIGQAQAQAGNALHVHERVASFMAAHG
ncbi:hypothetical protein [Tahibacter amnicola]|uniref:Uncharacterized protein n=1 Tax=Tahibacter amnicola TaxID=2976241 RepID=A0ABY6BKP2_9GAMM|nr:hypothetical protein [Tahibacter amnicola]UXI68367.1 hypothetical protein N4264_01565 [Tahibacter amnicola]